MNGDLKVFISKVSCTFLAAVCLFYPPKILKYLLTIGTSTFISITRVKS